MSLLTTLFFFCPLLAAAIRTQGQSAPPPALRNPGFESADPLADWDTHIYGATPQIGPDTQIHSEGKQSLHVASQEPTDTAFGQEVMLQPGHLYHLRGRVRTRNLDPHGAPVYGTFQIQRSGGQGVIARGKNHGGDTEWTPVDIYFQAPDEGITRIVAFFAGFGKGTGEAWFDDLKIEPLDITHASVKVTREPLNPGRIDPMQCGQFVEYLCTLVPAMWAEKLYDGSFEGLTPYKFVYLAQTDFKEKPWYPCGATNRAEYLLDHDTKVNGEVSQRIRVPGGAPCTVGVAQDGIAVERNQPCRFSIWLRQEGIAAGKVHVRLHREGRPLADCSFAPGTEWKQFSAHLTPADTTTGATLSIEFDGPGTLWLDLASLMPEDTVGGWRRDVVEATKAIPPGIIRFGGSALDDGNLGDFEWKDTVGPVEHRKPFQAWGGQQPIAAGLEEIVQFCHAVNAEPLMCVRSTGRTAKNAADEVEYFNGAVDTPMGALRARNGHPEPYHIRYWQVGNERSGPDYETRLPDFCRAMKAVDPSIVLLSSYPTPGVLRGAGEWLDYVCPHQYDCADIDGEREQLDRVRQMIHDYAPPGRHIKIAVTEWNTTAGDAGPRRAMLWTLANALACSRYQNLMHRYCDSVEIANRSNLINSFCSGILQTDTSRLYKTPTYYSQQLYATLEGDRPLRPASDLPSDFALDISATLSPKGDTVTLFVVNSTLQEITRPIDLTEFGNAPQEVVVRTLTDRDHAGSPDVTNSFGDPERIATVRSVFHAPGGKFDFPFPALSLTVLQWKVTH